MLTPILITPTVLSHYPKSNEVYSDSITFVDASTQFCSNYAILSQYIA